jgi:hypothetical protein
MKRIFLFLSIFVVLFSCNCVPRTTRVLFIGNSYTKSGDLPSMFLELAKAGGHRVDVGTSLQGGWDLRDHLKEDRAVKALNSKKWQYVVLQEQSLIPAFEEERIEKMYPAARELDSLIKERGARTVFFVTWGRQWGIPEAGMKDYESMQDEIDRGYGEIAEELDATLAPVGTAWRIVATEHPDMKLWQGDGSHPATRGTYLAACVFYAMFFQESPVGLSYAPKLPEEDIKILQEAAAEAVLK